MEEVIMMKLIALLAISSLLGAVPSPALAGEVGISEPVMQRANTETGARVCIAYAELRKALQGKYGESPVAFGVHANGSLMQVFASDAGDTWTVVMTSPKGISCIVAGGNDWYVLPPALGPQA
jgi:tetrahydromethanopterin S-methyltransferase subunit C